MPTSDDLRRLADFFSDDDIEWKPIAVSKRSNKGLAAAYVTSRAIQQRLDDVCGPGGWRNEFATGPGGGVLCGISVRVERPDGTAEWVTKWDGAENTEVEAVKGGLSNAMKRAASHWGIGRYLYDLPQQWVPVDDRGRFARPPQIPSQYLPASAKPAAPVHPVAPAKAAAPSQPATPTPQPASSPQSTADTATPRRATQQATRKHPARTTRRSDLDDYRMPGGDGR